MFDTLPKLLVQAGAVFVTALCVWVFLATAWLKGNKSPPNYAKLWQSAKRWASSDKFPIVSTFKERLAQHSSPHMSATLMSGSPYEAVPDVLSNPFVLADRANSEFPGFSAVVSPNVLHTGCKMHKKESAEPSSVQASTLSEPFMTAIALPSTSSDTLQDLSQIGISPCPSLSDETRTVSSAQFQAEYPRSREDFDIESLRFDD